MNNETILKKAIEKARENGCKKYQADFVKDWDEVEIRGVLSDRDFAKAFFKNETDIEHYLVCSKCKEEYSWFDPKKYNIGDNIKYCSGCGAKLEKKERKYEVKWEYFLSQMVLSPDPIKYLKEYLK